MSPEKSLFPSDERTLEQRYEDVCAERDDLELRYFELRQILLGIYTHELNPYDLMALRSMATASNPPSSRPKVDFNSRQPVVYYVEMTGFVKIGYTIAFAQRMQTFHVRREQVLAVEPGDRTLEHQRHRDFMEKRQPKTELFAHFPALDEHIAALRVRYPDPWATGREMTRYKDLPAA